MKNCYALINRSKGFVAFFPKTAQGKQQAAELRRNDARMKRARIEEVLQTRPSFINGQVYNIN